MTEAEQIAAHIAARGVTVCPPRVAPGLSEWERALGTVEAAPISEHMHAARARAQSIGQRQIVDPRVGRYRTRHDRRGPMTFTHLSQAAAQLGCT